MHQLDASNFARAFQEAGGLSALSYSNFIRFLAVMLVIVAVLWSINHFLDSNAKASESFMVQLGSRVVRLVIGLTFFILFLTT